MTSSLFFSMALASLGFSAIRLSLGHALRDMVPALTTFRILTRWGGIFMLALSVMPCAAAAPTPLIGGTIWLFCLLPLTALPLVTIWPYAPKYAVNLPPTLFLLASVLAAVLQD